MIGMVDIPEDREALRRLLRQFNENVGDREQLEREIQGRFGKNLAILVMDASGFSRMVRAEGIVHFLALLERLERLVTPMVERAGGRILKKEADNLFALFEDPKSALACAIDIVSDFRTINEALPRNEEIYVSLGIGYGELLMVGAEDLYGDQMNIACKLGEDLAQQEEILLTAEAYAAVADAGQQFEERDFGVSGLSLIAYKVVA
jgi:adenylate cyclase